MRQKEGKIAEFRAKRNPEVRRMLEQNRGYDIYSKGEKVGNLYLHSEGNTTNIEWIGINKKQRGKKFAQQVMDYVIKTEKQNGKKYITLEVPGDSPDARHIYEKKGFIAEERSFTDEDDVWGGLTKMRKKL